MIWHNATANEVMEHFGVDGKKGLANGSIDEKIENFGQNVVTNSNRKTLLTSFLSQLNNKMVIVLIVVSVLSFILSLAYNQPSPFSAFLIIAIVLINAFLSAYHVYKCDIAFDNIKHASNHAVTVLRDGIIRSVNSAYIVPGDIIILEEGDYIPADARIIESSEFRCNEFSITGSDIPTEKSADAVLEDITPLENRSNMVFAGCSVAHGFAKAIVTATGLFTENGKTAAMSEQSGETKLPLQNQLDFIGRIANIIIFSICALVFLIAMIQNFSSGSFAAMTVGVLLNSVALAVAAIPEGLPMIATIVIALGFNRILNDNIIIKDAGAVELLGKTDVLCCDKTGVLTRNKMQVSKIFDGKDICNLNDETPNEKMLSILKIATACSTLNNDSTEYAIEKACLSYNSMSIDDINNIFPHVAEISFDSNRKTMSVITMINKTPYAIVKGAVETLIENCSDCDKEAVLKLNDEFASEGLRIVAIGLRKLTELPANPIADEIERDLTFVGLIALDDPPRDDVIEDIEACKKAGIKVVMITGDNPLTAKTVARRIGIFMDDSLMITGAELNDMTDEELCENIDKYSVFARVSANDKLRIVKAWKSKKMRVTITGDSISDVDSLSEADVGCAIGRYGADVAKGNADIIITNNRFHSILLAIKESRGLFSNIKKSVFYLFSCNFAELLFVLIGLLIFRKFPIAALPLLWINLITDSAPAISLSMESAEKEIMETKSTFDFTRIFDLRSILLVLAEGFYIAIMTLIAFAIGNGFGDFATASTMAFSVLGLSQIFHCYNCKYLGQLIGNKVFGNKFMNYSALLALFVLIFLTVTPAGYLFGFKALRFANLIICLLLSVSVIPAVELIKLTFRLIYKKIGCN